MVTSQLLLVLMEIIIKIRFSQVLKDFIIQGVLQFKKQIFFQLDLINLSQMMDYSCHLGIIKKDTN